MFIKKTVLLVSLAGSIIAQENNQNPGDIASKNHPQAFLTSKVAGGTVGVVGGLFTILGCLALHEGANKELARLEYPAVKIGRIGRIMALLMVPPILYGSWKGGQAVSKASWDLSRSGVDKIQKFKESLNQSV